MKIDKIKQGCSDTLIVCMAGWSISPEFMKSLSYPNHVDVWLVYDYRDLTFEESFSAYQHVHLIAWSLGVWVATQLWVEKNIFDSSTAINGTPFPIDDRRGIPQLIFEGTLQHVDEDGMRRFNRRMCGNKELFNKYSTYPSCPIKQAKEELNFLYTNIVAKRGKIPAVKIYDFWNHAIISTRDLIFPTDNLRECWLNHCTISEIDAPHLPFYYDELTDVLWKQLQKNS